MEATRNTTIVVTTTLLVLSAVAFSGGESIAFPSRRMPTRNEMTLLYGGLTEIRRC